MGLENFTFHITDNLCVRGCAEIKSKTKQNMCNGLCCMLA